MKITNVRIIKIEDDDRLKAFVTVEVDSCLTVRDIKIIKGDRGNFVAMPAKKMKDGSFKDIIYMSTPEMRRKLERVILEKYEDMG